MLEIKKIYAVLTGSWNEAMEEFFKTAEKDSSNEIYVVINQSDLINYFPRIKNYTVCKKIIDGDKSDFEGEDFVTVFPNVPRKLIVKTALCIEDTFEIKWIRQTIENGQKIVFNKKGLERFTGNESNAYIQTILSYIRKILEYDISIPDAVSDISNTLSVNKTDEINISEMSGEKLNTNNVKRIITSNDLDCYLGSKVIVINAQDIITTMAQDKALALGIKIIRN